MVSGCREGVAGSSWCGRVSGTKGDIFTIQRWALVGLLILLMQRVWVIIEMLVLSSKIGDNWRNENCPPD